MTKHLGLLRRGRDGRMTLMLMLAVGALSAVGAQTGPQGAAPASSALRVIPVQGRVSMIAGQSANVAVHTGDEGTLVVDTMTAAVGEALLATIQSISTGPMRFIVNTSADANRTGGNAQVAKGGEEFSRNTANNAPARYPTRILAHENVLKWMQMTSDSAALPTDTYFVRRKELAMSHEPIQMVHLPAAHSDGDSVVMFRRSDVLVTGAAFTPDRYPVIDVARGGTFVGYLAGLNLLIDLTVTDHNQQGGTMVVPGSGRIGDESDVAEYRDMVTIVRDRVQALIDKKMTLDQVKAARLTRDYDPVYSRPDSTGEQFVEVVYRGLTPPARRR